MRVNIEQQLLKQRNKRTTEADILQQVQHVLTDDYQYEDGILETLLHGDTTVNHPPI